MEEEVEMGWLFSGPKSLSGVSDKFSLQVSGIVPFFPEIRNHVELLFQNLAERSLVEVEIKIKGGRHKLIKEGMKRIGPMETYRSQGWLKKDRDLRMSVELSFEYNGETYQGERKTKVSVSADGRRDRTGIISIGSSPVLEDGEDEEQSLDILSQKGFKPISRNFYGIPSTLYWHPGKKFELQLTRLGPNFLLKGMKKYYIKGISEEGKETWDRNLGKLMDRIRSSFAEYHLYASGLSDIPDSMVPDEEISKKESKLNKLEHRIDCLGNLEAVRGVAGKVELDLSNLSKREQNYLKKFVNEDSTKITAEKAKKERKRLEKKVGELKEGIQESHEFIKQFSQKAHANSYIIACSTPLFNAKEENLEAVVDETIQDIETKHTHGGFTQSVEKNLKVNIAEVGFPWITYQAEFVGLLSPDQELSALTDYSLPYFYLTASEDIKVGGKVKKKGKKTPARIMKSFLDKVETESRKSETTKDVPTEGGWVGNLVQGDKVTDIPFLFNLDKLNHGYLSGTTGSGKTYTARVLVENAILKGVNIVVLDPTRQWCGLAKPASGIKKRLKKLGVEQGFATGFPADIYTPNSSAGKKLPQTLSDLADGVSVVALKGLYDEERCEIARDILSDIYMSTDQETEQLKTLMVIEEAHTFLPGNVDPSAKEVAKECEKRVERISREARKYGLNLLVVSQSLSDFKRSSKTVREMMNSKFFMRATDRSEINYVEDYVSKEAAGWVRNLDVGEVLVNSPGVGPAKVFVRPPFSEVGELSDSEIEEAVGAQEEKFEGVDKGEFLAKVSAVKEGEVKAKPETSNLSEEEEKLIQVAKKHLEEEDEPIHLTKAAEKAEIYSMGKLSELVDDLEERGLIETKKLKKRGNPRGIIPKT